MNYNNAGNHRSISIEPVARSGSLESLETRTNGKKRVPKFADDTNADISRPGRRDAYNGEQDDDDDDDDDEEAKEQRQEQTHLLQDLDSMLRNKLKIGVSSPVLGLKDEISKNDRLSPRFLSPEPMSYNMREKGMNSIENELGRGPISQIPQSPEHMEEEDADQQDLSGDEDEEDEEFANVDEIDGPISMNDISKTKPSKPVTTNHNNIKKNDIKRLFRDRSNQNQKEQESHPEDYNIPMGEDFQKKLEKRLAELDTDASTTSTSKSQLSWSLKYFRNLQDELPEWFTSSDYTYFSEIKTEFEHMGGNVEEFLNNMTYAKLQIDNLIKNLSNEQSSSLLSLAYISMGTFASCNNMVEQLSYIRRNNLLLCDNLDAIIETFKELAMACKDDETNLKRNTTLFYYSSTILYFVTTVAIEKRDTKKTEVDKIIGAFERSEILSFLVKYIEQWRWHSRLSMRIRNMISLLFKLLLLQFGDEKVYNRTKASVYSHNNLIYSKDSRFNANLSVSPLQYLAFREDIRSRFPEYELPEQDLPRQGDNSNSLSQFLEIPRSKSKSSMNLTLAIPEVHIATPAPSPPQSPDLAGRGTFGESSLKARKSFQTNMAYPYLYPSDDEEDDDLSEKFPSTDQDNLKSDAKNKNNDVFVPYSVEEASKILAENLEIKLSTKQLWEERDIFMLKERGWSRNEAKTKSYLSIEDDKEVEYLQIMKRIGSFYQNCLPSLNSLIFVLLQTMESNLSNIDYKLNDEALNEDRTELLEASIESLKPQLEIMRAKELSLRASAGTLYLLLKWLKLNHILKFEQLSILIYDSRYVNICTSLLAKYSEGYVDRVFNKTITVNHSCWTECAKFNATYKGSISSPPLTSSNHILSSFAYSLKILRKITGNKIHRLKTLPLSIGFLFKKYYRIFNLDIYHPMLKIVKELTPFKNKKWKSEHMDLISGVYLYEKLELMDNWVTGKDIPRELNDACGQEIALRALVQFYNFNHYELSMEDLGYSKRSTSASDLIRKEVGNVVYQ
ncbi:hypothetical protein KAFR_0J02150 [Kazachstania africana CBS 2517]|uniref:Factor arrest protein 11 n=1 Tax=Kazachstania africana (strain ATCC 22294 / BCRC 22015 / CBS 2517 / CECT 1963 / NBRC 1671 / NRRL Y-8276) TaxID=1071382 RepID=H2B0X9_KAZAF|nr:hypothetical protein KAFR_0J02150 [Kazachstania africana CBS 2517]CCF60279.1 hypothetical protein KAFR_0J02150 [Kazachstania africana CBS 2517]